MVLNLYKIVPKRTMFPTKYAFHVLAHIIAKLSVDFFIVFATSLILMGKKMLDARRKFVITTAVAHMERIRYSKNVDNARNPIVKCPIS